MQHGELEKEGDLLATVMAALDGDQPEACLVAAMDVLRVRGLARTGGVGDAWLEMQRGGRRLVLVADPGVEPPGPTTRAVLERALGAALSRAAEQDDYRKLSERMAMLQAASFDGIFLHDEGVIVDCNERLCEILGYSREEMFDPNSMARGVAPEDLAEARERVRQRLEGEFLLTCVRKDGSRLRAEFRTKQTRLGERPIRVVALRDVTERERNAALLRESETRLRQILEATFDAVVISRDGVMVDLSEGAARFFGLPCEALLGRSVLDVVAPDARDEVSKRLQE